MVDAGWNTHLILGFCPYFQGRTVSFRECTLPKLTAKWENNPKPKKKGIISQPPFLKGSRFGEWIVLHLPSKLGDMIQFDKYSSIGLKPQTRHSCFWCMGGVFALFSVNVWSKQACFPQSPGKSLLFLSGMWFVLVQVILYPSSHKRPIYVWWTASVLYPPNLDKVFFVQMIKNQLGWFWISKVNVHPQQKYLEVWWSW